MFLGKSPKGSLPVLNAHSFTLESAEEGIFFHWKNVPDERIDHGNTACEAEMLPTMLPTGLPRPVNIQCDIFLPAC